MEEELIESNVEVDIISIQVELRTILEDLEEHIIPAIKKLKEDSLASTKDVSELLKNFEEQDEAKVRAIFFSYEGLKKLNSTFTTYLEVYKSIYQL